MKKIIFLILLSTLFTDCISEKGEDETMDYVKAGDPVPAGFVLKGGDGSVVFQRDDFYGKRSLLFFFVSECGDCRKVFPIIDELWPEIESDYTLQLVAVSREEEAAKVTEYFDSKRYRFPFYTDLDRSVFSLFANNTVPRIYIINRSGYVEWMSVNDTSATARELLEKLRE